MVARRRVWPSPRIEPDQFSVIDASSTTSEPFEMSPSPNEIAVDPAGMGGVVYVTCVHPAAVGYWKVEIHHLQIPDESRR